MSKERISCPSKDKNFKKYWRVYYPKLSNRANFSRLHSKYLEILCQLCVDYDNLNEILQTQGFSYCASGRYGEQIKTRPEALERDKVLTQLQKYCKLLNLSLDKEEKEKEDLDGFGSVG